MHKESDKELTIKIKKRLVDCLISDKPFTSTNWDKLDEILSVGVNHMVNDYKRRYAECVIEIEPDNYLFDIDSHGLNTTITRKYAATYRDESFAIAEIKQMRGLNGSELLSPDNIKPKWPELHKMNEKQLIKDGP